MHVASGRWSFSHDNHFGNLKNNSLISLLIYKVIYDVYFYQIFTKYYRDININIHIYQISQIIILKYHSIALYLLKTNCISILVPLFSYEKYCMGKTLLIGPMFIGTFLHMHRLNRVVQGIVTKHAFWLGKSVAPRAYHFCLKNNLTDDFEKIREALAAEISFQMTMM